MIRLIREQSESFACAVRAQVTAIDERGRLRITVPGVSNLNAPSQCRPPFGLESPPGMAGELGLSVGEMGCLIYECTPDGIQPKTFQSTCEMVNRCDRDVQPVDCEKEAEDIISRVGNMTIEVVNEALPISSERQDELVGKWCNLLADLAVICESSIETPVASDCKCSRAEEARQAIDELGATMRGQGIEDISCGFARA